MASITGEESILQRITSTWGEMFGSSALHTQTTALGEGIKSCTVGRGTIVTITTRDWQVMLQSISNKLLQWVFLLQLWCACCNVRPKPGFGIGNWNQGAKFFLCFPFLGGCKFWKATKIFLYGSKFYFSSTSCFYDKKTSSY